MLLSDAVTLFLRSRDVKPATIAWYEHRLSPLADAFGNLDVTAVTAEHLRRWRDELSRRPRPSNGAGRPTNNGSYSPHTVRGHIRACRVLFGWLHRREVIDSDPSQHVRLPDAGKREIAAISEGSIERIVAAARATSARDHALVLVLRDSGARVSGLCSMTRVELDLRNSRGIVHEKNDRTRTVFFLIETGDALRLYLRHRSDAYDALWIGQRGPLTPSGVYQLLRRTAERADVEPPYNPHSFRHALARRMLRNGASLDVIADVLGHSSVETTRRFYARWSVDELQDKHRRYAANGSPGDMTTSAHGQQRRMW